MARCPICGKSSQNKAALIQHVEKFHEDEIPKDLSTAHYIYKLNHDGRDYGLCRVCGKPTGWNEKSGKPYQICWNPACKEKIKQIAQERMMKTYGKVNLLDDIHQQQKMLANRKISGTYTWSDGKHRFTYTGSYEKFALEWLDKVFDMDPNTIQTPGPIVEYDFNGEKKYWITDMYLIDFNLIVEIKDGGSDKNKHEGFAHNRELEAAKDAHMKHQKEFNYTKITNKNMLSLLEVLEMVRINNLFEDDEKVIYIHENANIDEDKPIFKIDPLSENINELNFMSNEAIEEACNRIINKKETNYLDELVDSLESINESTEVGSTLTEAFNSFDTAITWKDKLFGKSNFLKKIFSPFTRVYINKENHTIEIRGIHYKKLIQHIKKIYPDNNIYKIFEFIYNDYDWSRYEKKKISKNNMRIEYIHTYEFFALELIILFNQLYERFRYTYYQSIANEIYEKSWVSKSDEIVPEDLDINKLKNIKYDLKPYQLEFIKAYPKLKAKLNLKGYCLSFDQGLGKTLTSIALFECLELDRVYIVCPNALMDNWAIEIKQYYDKYEDDKLWHKEVYIKNSKYGYDKSAKFVIVNQESIQAIFDKIEPGLKNMVIVDESHNFRNINSARLSELLKLKELTDPRDCLIMSGTPIKASPSEICPALLMIDPMFTEDVAKVYNKCFYLDNIVSSDIIQKRFNNIMYRKTKDEVLDLPDKTIKDLYFPVSNPNKYLLSNVKADVRAKFNEIYDKERKNYDQMRLRYIQIINQYSKGVTQNDIDRFIELSISNSPDYELHEMDIKFRNEFIDLYIYQHGVPDAVKTELDELVRKFVRMRNSCMGQALGAVLHPRRQELFTKLFLENKDRIISMITACSKKTVIFTTFVSIANTIYDELNKDGIKTVIITGSSKDRLESILQFKQDPATEVIVCTSQTLGTGVTLTEASQMFFFGTPWRSTDFNQCCDRIYRIGQTEDVTIYKVMMSSAEKNLSTRMDEILNWSNEMFDSIISSTDADEVNKVTVMEEGVTNEAPAVMSIANLAPIIGGESDIVDNVDADELGERVRQACITLGILKEEEHPELEDPQHAPQKDPLDDTNNFQQVEDVTVEPKTELNDILADMEGIVNSQFELQ